MSTIGVFIDLKKAFDTINHNILLEKLDHYGIRGITNQWLKSYLTNRQQYVRYNETDSSLSKIICGVPRGSILGPILFILYINNLCNVSDILKFVLFADDTNLFRSGTDIELLCESINNELIKINSWFKSNKLSLNISKTNFIVFTNSSQIEKFIDINIDANVIERVYETKFLGVIIDNKLNWKSHITQVRNKLNKCISVIYKASQLVCYTVRFIYHT